MTTATLSTALATIQPVFTDPERLALAGFLAGIRGLTREAYALDPAPVHQLVPHPVPCLVRRPPRRHRRFARELEARGRARATVTRRLCTIAGSTSTPSKKSSSSIPRPLTSAVCARTTSRAPSPWTATSSARCW